jgi:hypothetical protein
VSNICIVSMEAHTPVSDLRISIEQNICCPINDDIEAVLPRLYARG